MSRDARGRNQGEESQAGSASINPDFRLPTPYKTLLMLALVAGPFIWLALTEDGQRRTDLALMSLLGKPDFNAALETFDSHLTESRLRETFPRLRLQCVTGANPFGNRLCRAEIGAFNQIPATSLTLFLREDRLQAVKVVYRHAYHATIQEWLDHRLATRQVSPIAAPLPERTEGVIARPVMDGVIALREGALARTDEPALFWLSRAAIAEREQAPGG